MRARARHGAWVAGVLVIVALAGLARAEAGPTKVSYVAGASVYVTAGRAEGLAEGDTLDVVRLGRVVARLRVAYLSTHRAACDTLAAAEMPRVDDEIRFTPHAIAPSVAQPESSAVAPLSPGESASQALPSATSPARSARVRGRVGARYLAAQMDGPSGYSEPAVDAYVSATDFGGGRLDAIADLRARRVTVPLVLGGFEEQERTRVYRLSLTARTAGGKSRVTLGRQASVLLSSVGLFDGAMLETTPSRLGFRLFGGTEPDPVTFAISKNVVQTGGMIEWRARPGTREWSLGLGGVASWDSGQVNRQFGFVQGDYRAGRWSGAVAQEVDLNTGWRRSQGESMLSLTSTYLSWQFRAAPRWSLNGGYDERRDVRLYRDRDTPETEFDDRYRSGGWIGAWGEPVRNLRLGADARIHREQGDHGYSGSWTTEWSPHAFWHPRLRGRAAYFHGDALSSTLGSFSVGLDPDPRVGFALEGGVRNTDETGTTENVRWAHFDVTGTLARALLLQLSYEKNFGGLTSFDQQYASLSWRF